MENAVAIELKINQLLLQHEPNQEAINKMHLLNLDVIKPDFIPLFSPTGRPSNYQPEIFRSFVLMAHFKYGSIDEWVSYASSSPFISALSGVSQDEYPGASTHRDFISRLWQSEGVSHEKVFVKKSKKKHGKEKMPPERPGIVFEMAEKALAGEVFDDIPERLFQSILYKTAVLPSANMGLLGDTNDLYASADGACVLSHSSTYGHRICKCEGECACPRWFADPEANWGWDSYHEVFFFGFTMYTLTVHNAVLHLDLPIYLRFETASQHDSVTLISALSHARAMFTGSFTITNLLADSAHDNYSTYNLLNNWDIRPFIDLNPRRSDNKPQSESEDFELSENGVPVCILGREMTNWGIDKARHRRKYRCPLCAGSISSCPFDDICNETDYGKIVYLRLSEDLRMFTPVQRGSEEWTNIYKQRTAVERTNTRILTDYQLERPKRYGRKKIAFFAFCNAVNVHLDAQIRFKDYVFDTGAA